MEACCPKVFPKEKLYPLEFEILPTHIFNQQRNGRVMLKRKMISKQKDTKSKTSTWLKNIKAGR